MVEPTESVVPEVYADFNARLADDRVWLNTRGSIASLAKVDVSEGDLVWVSDGECRALAFIESVMGTLVAKVDWGTVEGVS